MDNQPEDNRIDTSEKKEEKKRFPTELFSAPQNKLELSKLILHLTHIETKDVTLKWVFDHVRNYVICGVLLWAGINAFKLPDTLIIDMIAHKIAELC
ncbi:hypothetical protein QNM99_10615 [Pseudomonas sp. PCH446]